MCQGLQSLHILWQTRATISETWLEIVRRNIQLLILAEDFHNFMRINAYRLADITNLITKDNLQCMIGIIYILHHFSHLDICANKLCIDMLIHLTEYLFCILRISTNQCQWWIEVILNHFPAQ